MDTMHLPVNSLLQGGKYKIVRFIGSGGFGCTYEAIHTLFESRVAIKEFYIADFFNRDESTGNVNLATQAKAGLASTLKKKFIEEARAIFRMQHEHIVRVIDIFKENGTAYYVMNYIEGESLHDIVKQTGALPENKAVRYIRQVADALKYVHSLNRLHLDVKPGNIMIDDKDNAILIDFGASKHYDEESGENTSTLLGVNTKGYAPIEQQTSGFTTFIPATDIYSLGATLYNLLTGITPPDASSLISEEVTLQPLPLSISEQTRTAVSSAMQLKRKNRPQSIDEFLSIIDDSNEATVLDDKSDETKKKDNVPQKKNHKKKFLTKKSFIKIVSIATVCLLVIACATYFIINHYTDKAKPDDFSSYLKEAEKGDAETQYKLAMCYYKGDGVTKDYKKAFEWFRKSANQGYAEAQTMLGECYYYGEGVSQDYKKAVELYKKAAKQGNAAAKCDLGVAYYNGDGVEQNYSIAVWWFRKAADQGDANAQQCLGDSYYYGEGVSQDYVEAVKWFRKSADQCNSQGQYLLGICYENGHGVAKDKAKAEELYKLAADQGNEEAIKALVVLEDGGTNK